jgi:hypothetical protein
MTPVKRIGVTVYTLVELLAEWAQLSRHSTNLRRALPPGFARRDDLRQLLAEQLRQAVAELQQLTDYDTLVDGLPSACMWPTRGQADVQYRAYGEPVCRQVGSPANGPWANERQAEARCDPVETELTIMNLRSGRGGRRWGGGT